jgi:hypothetical protein
MAGLLLPRARRSPGGSGGAAQAAATERVKRNKTEFLKDIFVADEIM